MQTNSEQDLENFQAITGCKDLAKAQQYLQMSENNLDNAIQLYFDLEGGAQLSKQTSQQSSQQSQNVPIRQNEQFSQNEVRDGMFDQYVVNTMIFNQLNPVPDLIRQRSAPGPEAELIEKYRKYQEEKRARDDGLILKAVKWSLGAIGGLFKSAPNYGIEFQNFLHSQKIQSSLQFQMGNFKDNLNKTQEEYKPLLLYIHSPQFLFLLKKMSENASFVGVVNKNYRILGLLANEEVFNTLPFQPDPPIILIYRLDLTDKTQLMAQFPLTLETDFEQLAQTLKQLKGQFNKQFIHDEQIKKEANAPQQQQYIPNHSYQQQQRQQQTQMQRQREQTEREQLRFQQEEAYKQAEQQAMEKKRKEEEKRKLEEERILKQQHEEEARQLHKATLLSNLPHEPEDDEGIQILFRFIDSQKTRKFNMTDKIQTLFDFVQCQEDVCFNNPKAEIDLIQNFPRLSLKDKVDKEIGEIFVDSIMEQLIVEENE